MYFLHSRNKSRVQPKPSVPECLLHFGYIVDLQSRHTTASYVFQKALTHLLHADQFVSCSAMRASVAGEMAVDIVPSSWMLSAYTRVRCSAVRRPDCAARTVCCENNAELHKLTHTWGNNDTCAISSSTLRHQLQSRALSHVVAVCRLVSPGAVVRRTLASVMLFVSVLAALLTF